MGQSAYDECGSEYIIMVKVHLGQSIYVCVCTCVNWAETYCPQGTKG